jgi:hypothetical protein
MLMFCFRKLRGCNVRTDGKDLSLWCREMGSDGMMEIQSFNRNIKVLPQQFERLQCLYY